MSEQNVKSDQKSTLMLDGVQYDTDQFSSVVQQAVGVYNRFAAQLQEQQLEVLKTQAAIAHFSAQIASAVKSELNPEPTE